MGLFSSKYETHVGTSVARVIEDHSLPDSVKHGAVKGLFDDSGQFVENMMEEVISGIGVKADRMFSYGKNKYAYGLPVANTLTSNSGQSVVETTIEAIVGQAVTLNYYHLGALNNLHLGFVKLIADHGFNPNTQQLGVLTAAKGKPVKLTSVAVVVTEASLLELSNGSLDQWEPVGTVPTTGNDSFDALLKQVNAQKKPKLFELDAAAPNDYLRVEYSWIEDYTAVVEGVNVPRTRSATGSFTIPVLGFDESADWHQAKYTRADGQIGYWLYQADAGTYPAVDALNDPGHTPDGSYFPWAYFRFNKVSGNADKTSNWFKQSKKMLDYVGIDFEAVTDAIHQNPDIANVEQAMFMMAVPAVTTDQMEMRYLFDFFNRQLENTGGDLQENKPYQSGGSISEDIARMLDSSRLDASILIQDQRFKTALGFRHISKKIVQGTVGDGKVGTYASGYGSEVITETGSNTAGGGPVSWNTAVKSHWYRKQTTETQYEEVRVNNLKVTYFIFEQYTTIGDENDDILMIPIDRAITRGYSIPDRELLYARSMHYVFNSRVITEVKWYQQGWFRAVLVIAAIIITIVTYGETWQAIGAALAAGEITISAVIYMIAIEVIEQILIAQALKLFVRVVGVKFAIVAAIVLATIGVYQAIDAGSIAGAPWAKELLSLSTGLSKGVNTELNREFGQLKKESDDFQLFVKEEQKKLDEANKLLENTNWMTPLIIFGEKPDDYYHRTVHSGNIGVLSLDAISAYVDVSLTLPELTDTL